MSVTPTSDSNTTSADTPPAASALASTQALKMQAEGVPNGQADGTTPSPSQPPTTNRGRTQMTLHPDYPDAKVLLISSKRPRSFFERTVRELIAGGTDVVVLSALGDVIPMCILLKTSLEAKQAAITVKMETTYIPFRGTNQRGSGGYRSSASARTAGLRVYMKRHPEFKGSRISPSYVTFLEAPIDGEHASIYEAEPKDKCGAVNCGDPSLYVGGSGINRSFGEILTAAGQNIESYEPLHKALLAKAMEENAEKANDSDVRAAVLTGEELNAIHSDLKLGMCRPCKALEGKGTTGSVYLSIFKTEKSPLDQEKNQCMVYVVGPKGDEYPNMEDFLDAVRYTGVNLMTILCDYNGIVRREGSSKSLQKLGTCRISLFSGGIFRHPQANKNDIAKAIISGLEEGYRHGPAPRMVFDFDDDSFKQAWIESTGLDVYDSTTPMAKE